MRIRSDFDSGNIQVLDSSDPARVRLAIRDDFASAHFQWFHFLAEDLQPGQTYAFCIENAGQSSYANAWRGYQVAASYDGEQWFRASSHYEAGELHFILNAEHSSVYFAYFQPYSRARAAQQLVAALALPNVSLEACGTSLQGRDLPLLKIRGTAAAPKKIWFIAQQHPGEHMAQWFIEGLLEQVAQGSHALTALLTEADLYVIPNMNPDGAFLGNLRTNAAGQDLNRAWRLPSLERSPEVVFAQEQMARIGVDAFFDIHGDEEIPYVFAAGCEGNPAYSPRLAALERAFRQQLQAQAEFQSEHGYPLDAPGQANLALACNWVGQQYDCLAFTIEMPFKDHDLNPQPGTGWSAPRSKQLASAMLEVLADQAPTLR